MKTTNTHEKLQEVVSRMVANTDATKLQQFIFRAVLDTCTDGTTGVGGELYSYLDDLNDFLLAVVIEQARISDSEFARTHYVEESNTYEASATSAPKPVGLFEKETSLKFA